MYIYEHMRINIIFTFKQKFPFRARLNVFVKSIMFDLHVLRLFSRLYLRMKGHVTGCLLMALQRS